MFPLQAFRLNGVEPFRPEGEKFDPNQHEALFQLPDRSKEPGTVGVVTKVRLCRSGAALACYMLTFADHADVERALKGPLHAQTGYRMHNRVLRAAEVGVVAQR